MAGINVRRPKQGLYSYQITLVTPCYMSVLPYEGCRKKYPISACFYCRLEYHILKNVDGHSICPKCQHNLTQHGQPKHCKYCQAKAAFKSSCCSRCISSEKKYGPPVQCNKCKMNSAFAKGSEAVSKVGGKVLCLQCTLKHKRNQHRYQKEQRKSQNPYSSGPDSSTQEPTIAPLRAENLAVSFKTRFETVERSSKQNSRSNSPLRSSESAADHTFGDHMSEITKLRDQIAVLKKTIVQKEKIILEKDKKISEYNAERWEKEKSIRQRIQAIQKESNERIDNLQGENSTLRRQVAILQKSKKTPKPDRHISRIRLEPHKFGSPHTNRDAVGSCDSATESDSGLVSSVRKNKAESKLSIVADDEVIEDKKAMEQKTTKENTEQDKEVELKPTENEQLGKDGEKSPLNESMSDAEPKQEQLDSGSDNEGNEESMKLDAGEGVTDKAEQSASDDENNVKESRKASSDEENTAKDDSDGMIDDDDDDDDDNDDGPVDLEAIINSNQISFDQAQEAGIKMIMKQDADDEYSSSATEEQQEEKVEQQLPPSSEKQQHQSPSQLTFEQDDDSDDDEEEMKSNRKKQAVKRKLSSDDDSDGETNNNAMKSAKKTKKERKKIQPQKSSGKNKGKTARQRTVSVSSASSDSSDSSDDE